VPSPLSVQPCTCRATCASFVPAQQYDARLLSGRPLEATGGDAPTATLAYWSAMIGTAPVLGQLRHWMSKAMCLVYFVGTPTVTDPLLVNGVNFSHTGVMVVLCAPSRPPPQLATPTSWKVRAVVPGAEDDEALVEGDGVLEVGLGLVGEASGDADVRLGLLEGPDEVVPVDVGEVSGEVVQAARASIAIAATAVVRNVRIVHPQTRDRRTVGERFPVRLKPTRATVAQSWHEPAYAAPPDG